jgi:hypothetical protein
LYRSFSGADLVFAVSVLGLSPGSSAKATQSAVSASGIDPVADARMPDRIFAIEDGCRSPVGSALPATSGSLPAPASG